MELKTESKKGNQKEKKTRKYKNLH